MEIETRVGELENPLHKRYQIYKMVIYKFAVRPIIFEISYKPPETVVCSIVYTVFTSTHQPKKREILLLISNAIIAAI